MRIDLFETGPYAALAAAAGKDDGSNVSVIYDPATGEISVDDGGHDLYALQIESAGGIFDVAMQKASPDGQNLDGIFDVGRGDKIAKMEFRGFNSLSFGLVAPAGLSEADLLADLTASGKFTNGVQFVPELVVVPEPGTLVMLLGTALLSLLLLTIRRRRAA